MGAIWCMGSLPTTRAINPAHLHPNTARASTDYRHGEDSTAEWERPVHGAHFRSLLYPQERGRRRLLQGCVWVSTCFSPSSSPSHGSVLSARVSVLLLTLPTATNAGLGPNLVGVTPEKAIKLAANDLIREALESPDGSLPLHKEMIAGAGKEGGREGGRERGREGTRRGRGWLVVSWHVPFGCAFYWHESALFSNTVGIETLMPFYWCNLKWEEILNEEV